MVGGLSHSPRPGLSEVRDPAAGVFFEVLSGYFVDSQRSLAGTGQVRPLSVIYSVLDYPKQITNLQVQVVFHGTGAVYKRRSWIIPDCSTRGKRGYIPSKPPVSGA